MPDSTTQLAGRREWLGLAVLALPTMLIGLDMTVLHLAAPQLSRSMNPSTTQLLWIVDIYGFMVAGFLMTMGTLGDRIGRRKLLFIGAGCFAAASLLAAYSSSVPMLMTARALLGVAGATLMPSTISLLSNMFTDPGQRRVAIAVWMANFMAGGMIGPLVGGFLLERFWWGSIFLIGVAIPVLLLLVGPLVLPEYRSPSVGRIDLLTAGLITFSIMAMVYGIKEAARSGLSLTSAAAVAIGVAGGYLFVLRQLRRPNPMIDLRLLFARKAFGVSLGSLTLGLFVNTGIQFLVLQYLQVVVGLTPLQAGVWVLPAMVAGIAGSLLAPVPTRWMAPSRVMGLGFLVGVIGLAVTALAHDSHSGALSVTGFAITSLGIQASLALANDGIIASVPPERAGTASGMGETGAELGNALGVAIGGSIATAVYQLGLPPSQAEHEQAIRDSFAGASAEGVPADVLEMAHQAFTTGVQVTAVVLAAVSAMLMVFNWRVKH